jgi:hypothetical protein
MYSLDLAVNNVDLVENVVHALHRFHIEDSRDIVHDRHKTFSASLDQTI